jgi:hypothetical protein
LRFARENAIAFISAKANTKIYTSRGSDRSILFAAHPTQLRNWCKGSLLFLHEMRLAINFGWIIPDDKMLAFLEGSVWISEIF